MRRGDEPRAAFFPEDQRKLAEDILSLGKPVIVALTSGRPLIDPWLFEKADAVLATWFLGSEAGAALADILTGAANPSGKLPLSWPCDAGQIPIFYGQRPTGRPAKADEHDTSKYLDVPVEPQFPFGHGLSFTRFVYGAPRASSHTSGGAIASSSRRRSKTPAMLQARKPLSSSSAIPLLPWLGLCSS